MAAFRAIEVRIEDSSFRHCERSEAIQDAGVTRWIASSLTLLAMTGEDDDDLLESAKKEGPHQAGL
jgi:hypothetical protein